MVFKADRNLTELSSDLRGGPVELPFKLSSFKTATAMIGREAIITAMNVWVTASIFHEGGRGKLTSTSHDWIVSGPRSLKVSTHWTTVAMVSRTEAANMAMSLFRKGREVR
jgi:hypothetical protein